MNLNFANLLVLFLLTVITATSKGADTNISDLKWKKRILLASTNGLDDTNLPSISRFITRFGCEIAVRHLEVIVYEHNLNAKYRPPPFIQNRLGIWLIGYDGDIKDFSNNDEILSRVFDLIDKMPIRQREINENPTECPLQ